METGFFKNPVADLDKEAAETYGLSEESGKVVADALLKEFERFMDFDEARANELADAFERGDSLREIVKEFEVDGISEEVILESETPGGGF